MASAMTLTTFAAGLKAYYTDRMIENLTYKTNPFLALVPKMEEMVGDSFVQPVIYSSPQSRSATFSTAQTLSTSKTTGIAKFAVTRVKDYGVITIDGETLLASGTDKGAFMRARTVEIDGIMNSVTQSLATALYRSGWGAIGTIDSPGASTTLTLENPEDIVNFEAGMVLQFSSAETGATLRDSGATLTVSSVNRSAGTMVVGANTNSISGISDGDYIFASGDRHNSASTTRYKVAGLEAWCPQTAPTSTAFFGLDRTTDTRLGGIRYDGSSYSIEEALVNAAVLTAKEGGKPDHCFISFTKFGNLVNSLGSKVVFDQLKVGGIGFDALRLYTPAGEVKVIPDRNCPSNRAFMLQLDTWLLGSLGKVPRILNLDSLESLRQASDDGVEIRIGYYGNLICSAPGWSCNVKL